MVMAISYGFKDYGKRIWTAKGEKRAERKVPSLGVSVAEKY